jgi:hypothetical protein
MKKITLFLVVYFCVLTQSNGQSVGNFDIINLDKLPYKINIFSSLYQSNPFSGLNIQSGASLNNAISGPSVNGFLFRWLANDTLVNFTNNADLIMHLTPKGDLVVKRSLNVPNLTVGSVSDTSYKKLVIAGANIPTNINSKRDISYEFAGAGRAAIRSYRGGSWDTFLQFLTSSYGNTGGEPVVRMHINHDGNVGLGNTNPFDHLNITGTVGTVINRIAIQNTGIPNSLFYVGNTSSDYTVTNQRSANILESYTDLHVGAANTGNIYFETGRTGTVAPISMTILNNGDVAIGTSATGGNKLAVEGTIVARRVKVTQNAGWADYVFNETYQLPVLTDLAAYIAKHKHLPGIPDAAEVAREGQDLGEMNRKLLEKVEELTLYIIQQDKRNNEQQAQIDMLIKQVNK